MGLSRRAFLAAVPGLMAAAPGKKPNIVVFMTDDHGAWATGAYGCASIATPNIDALARGGVRFTRAYACTPVCSPSRATFVTGAIPSNHGVQDWLRPADSFGPASHDWLGELQTYPEVLAANGYQCAMVGKWHMGLDERAHRGFTWWATVPGGGGTFKNPTFVKNGTNVPYEGFKEDAIGDFALEFLNQGDKEKPFYLHVPFYAPHTPYDFQPAADRAPYEGSAMPCYPEVPRHPNGNFELRGHHGNADSKKGYSALITGADRNIGRVLRWLEENNLRRDTLVVFTADQGWNAGHHGVWGKGNGTWPFNMYEESIRVPLIWNHPGRLKPGSPTQLVSHYDFFPTLLDYAGLSSPLSAKRPGRSYLPIVEGRSQKRTDKLFFEYSNVRAVRTAKSKLIERDGFPGEFYDLEKDPGESTNRYGDPSYAAEQARLKAELKQWFQSNGAPELASWRSTTKQVLTRYSATERISQQ